MPEDARTLVGVLFASLIATGILIMLMLASCTNPPKHPDKEILAEAKVSL